VKQLEGGLWKRVRCSSRVDWQVYPRLSRTVRLVVPAHNSQAEIAMIDLGAFSASSCSNGRSEGNPLLLDTSPQYAIRRKWVEIPY
jgi:hypothetical protein